MEKNMTDGQNDKLPFDEDEFENASDDAEFEIELSDDETSDSDTIIPKQADTEDEPLEEEEPDEEAGDEGGEDQTLSDDEKENYGKRAQKRIQQLVTQKKEADAKFQELQKTVQELQAATATYETRARTTDEQLLNDYVERNAQASENVKLKLRRAKEEGDLDAELNAQEELASIKAEGLLLSQYKRQQETEQAPAAQAPQQVDPSVVAKDRQKAYEWMRKNPWFRRANSDEDREMTLAAEQIHHGLIADGFRPLQDAEAYYNELDARLANEFPDGAPKSTGERKVTQKVGGGGTRTTTSSKSIKSGKSRVSLTKSEIATARTLGISLQDYAKEKLKRDAARA
jgi:hypothetical protein